LAQENGSLSEPQGVVNATLQHHYRLFLRLIIMNASSLQGTLESNREALVFRRHLFGVNRECFEA